MLDAQWCQARDALIGQVPEGANVLLPAGDWPDLPFRTTFYRSTDSVIAIDGHHAVLIHKGMLASFRQADIRMCLNDMAAVCANSVFVLFVERPRKRALLLPFHLRTLRIYTDPARYRRRNTRPRAFVHIPKAAGTSVWTAVSKAAHANIYFTSNTALAAFDGDLNAFELVGGHIHAETLIAKGWQGPAFFVLRDPALRVLSFIAHARRAEENLGLFDASFHMVRAMGAGVPDAAMRDLLFHEANMQVRMLGERAGDDLHDGAVRTRIVDRALDRLSAPGWSFGVVEQPAQLAHQVAAQFGLRKARLRHSNASASVAASDLDRAVRDFLNHEVERCGDIALYRRAIAMLSGS